MISTRQNQPIERNSLDLIARLAATQSGREAQILRLAVGAAIEDSHA